MLRTQKQRRELCKECPVAKVADILADPCSLLIVRDLMEGPQYFGVLNASLGMSTRTLTKNLRSLEHAGLIRRKRFEKPPFRVLYSLTPKGRGLKKVISEVRRYGKKYL